MNRTIILACLCSFASYGFFLVPVRLGSGELSSLVFLVLILLFTIVCQVSSLVFLRSTIFLLALYPTLSPVSSLVIFPVFPYAHPLFFIASPLSLD